MKRITAIAAILATIIWQASAETINIEQVMYSGPIPVISHATIGDITGLESIAAPLDIKINTNGIDFTPTTVDNLPKTTECMALNVIKAQIENRRYCEAHITVDSLQEMKVYIDHKPLTGKTVKLHPGTHTLLVKYVTDNDAIKTPVITVSTKDDGAISVVDDGKRMFTLDDVLYGTRIRGVSVSPSGSYMLVYYNDIYDGGKTRWCQKLYDITKQRFVGTINGYGQWLHKSDRYVVERNSYEHGRHLVAVNPADGSETILVTNMPDGQYIISPTEDFAIVTITREGEKEDPEIYQIIDPDDRQPGWRNRGFPAIYRFDNPVLQPLAIGKSDLTPLDISDDGTKLLLMANKRRLTARPTTLFSIISLDLNTMEADTIVADDGFISAAEYSPDGKYILVTGGPEAFDRVGCTIEPTRTPSMYDNQLFMVSLSDKLVKPLTRDFDPSINSAQWGRADGRIYLTATERDMYTAYILDPKSCAVERIDVPENVVNGVAISQSSPIIAVWGQSDSNPDAIYTYNTKNRKSQVVDRPSTERLKDVRLGTCTDWTFKNLKGETVYCRYYLPDNFDPSKQYPLIVNYYGGCTPSTRLFESRYPLHVYSSLGYVVLQIQPSGATGFGQEWSSRHVSTAGRGVAEDIIEGTKQFCNQMPYVNADKIGCIGASYGGFMTQYLLTQTDMFAAGISHAGISDHTSYWGEGYWGYSYSETSMGQDLPWTNTELYVEQSPLYNADKIHTPLLLLHGDDDHNVPVGESIQMYTALKLLGQDVAFVAVKDQDHHIIDYSKRAKWQDTIFAWFAKYLQDNNEWWEEMYPEK